MVHGRLLDIYAYVSGHKTDDDDDHDNDDDFSIVSLADTTGLVSLEKNIQKRLLLLLTGLFQGGYGALLHSR